MSVENIIGRFEEQSILGDIVHSEEPTFLAVTGRRRVGKTYLIKSYFEGRMDFYFTGILNAGFSQQIQNFDITLRKYFKIDKNTPPAAGWMEAFRQLSDLLDSRRRNQKIVIFIDELPWLDTPRSKFIQALDWFWNTWASERNVLLVVCGSSTSWMMNKLINNRGGLHNRVTKKLHLKPFSLHETELFLRSRRVVLDRYQIAQIYMAIGGIPHYLKEIRKGESAMQAIDRICFKRDGLLFNEFENLYQALFKDARPHLQVVHALATKLKGLTRQEIVNAIRLKDGGSLSKVLEELEWCDFITQTKPFGKTKKDALYHLTDEYSLFYIRFLQNRKSVNWSQLSATPVWKSWSGFVFEGVCIKHLAQIKRALGVAGVYTEVSGFIKKGTRTKKGLQIDLLIDRRDHVINVCEIKFHNQRISLTKAQATQLRERIHLFQEYSGTRKTLFPTFISTYGIDPNAHSIGLIEQEVKLEDLFEKK